MFLFKIDQIQFNIPVLYILTEHEKYTMDHNWSRTFQMNLWFQHLKVTLTKLKATLVMDLNYFIVCL